jgi:hypothetical protein
MGKWVMGVGYGDGAGGGSGAGGTLHIVELHNVLTA